MLFDLVLSVIFVIGFVVVMTIPYWPTWWEYVKDKTKIFKKKEKTE